MLFQRYDYVLKLSHTAAVCAFFRHYSIFYVPLNVLVRTPGGTRSPGWESLV
jgi:hypothetical protein